jgi:hypothetical protein
MFRGLRQEFSLKLRVEETLGSGVKDLNGAFPCVRLRGQHYPVTRVMSDVAPSRSSRSNHVSIVLSVVFFVFFTLFFKRFSQLHTF